MSVRTAFAAGLAGVLALSACSSGSSDSEGDGASASTNYKLAGVMANTSDPFWTSIVCGATTRASELGVDLKWYNSTSTDTNAIAANFQSATLTNPQGMIVSPFNNNQFVAQYTQLMNKGVPVVSGNGTQPQVEYKYIFSAADTGQFAEEALKNVGTEAGKMVYLGGAPGIPPLESRTKPFVEAVKAARPNLTALPDNFSGFDVNKATTSVAALILANANLKLVIAATGPDATGAAAAIKQAGKSGQITLIGFDAVPTEVSALKDGTITALIAQAPGIIGKQQVDAVVDYLKSGKGTAAVQPAGNAEVGNKLLTKETVDDPANADYVYKASC